MRGIGRGQRLHLLLPPEVAALIDSHARLVGALLSPKASLFHKPETAAADKPALSAEEAELKKQQTELLENFKKLAAAAGGAASSSATGLKASASGEAFLASSEGPAAVAPGCSALGEICGWLVVQQIVSESVQQRLLCEQNLASVWRKVALRRLLEDHAAVGRSKAPPALLRCLDVFREGLDFSIPDNVPLVGSFSGKLRLLVKQHRDVLSQAPAEAGPNSAVRAVEALLADAERQEELLRVQRRRQTEAGGFFGGDAARLDAMEAEFEQEQDQEQEEEQQQVTS